MDFNIESRIDCLCSVAEVKHGPLPMVAQAIISVDSCIAKRRPFWWLPLPILQNTVLTVVNQLLANLCFVTQNLRGTKTGQNYGKIKSRTLCPKYPLWNTSVSFAKVQICPLKNEGEIPISLIHNSFSYHCTLNVVIANDFDLKQHDLRISCVKFCFALCWTFSKTRTGNRTKDLPPLLSNPCFCECLNDRHLKMLNFR